MPSGRRRLSWTSRLRRGAGRMLKRPAKIGAKLVRPIERVFTRMARTALRAIERFEKGEKRLLRVGYSLSWPARALWAVIVRLTDLLLPKAVRKALRAPFRRLAAAAAWTGKALMRLAEALNLDGAIRKLVQWTRPVWYSFAALAGFFQAWLSTRRYKQLLWGLPAVLILLPIVAVASWTKLWGHGTIAANYRLAVKQALEDKDYKRVQLYERKLAQMGVDSRMTDFQTALALAQDGKTAEAYERMQALAPAETPGYPPAHMWVILQLLEEKLAVSKEDGHRLMDVHLDHLNTLGIRAPEVQLWRALWLVRGGQRAEAADLLQPLINRLPLAASMRMEMDMNLQRIDDARNDARAMRSHMQDRTRRGLPVLANEYRSWSIAEQLLGNIDQQEANVRAWLKLEPNNLEAQRILSVLCRRQFASLIALPDADPEKLAELFIEAAELTDDPRALQQQARLLYHHRERIPVASSPRAQAAILEAAGTTAAKAGEMAQAKTYLEQAIEKDPQNAIVWNNYAFVLSREANPDLERALQAVSKALELMPNDSQFRETRGQILVQMGKWKEAIPDLEFAVNAMPTSPEIHQALATAYDAIGEKQLARVHHQQAQ